MTVAAAPFLARLERVGVVGSTNDLVRGWLREGTPEVCVATADAQTAGRGREGRRWMAPAGSALLMSLGFRPTWLDAEGVWRLGALVSLAMAEAAETVADLRPGTIALKWPNDLVVVEGTGVATQLRKVAGVLGESDGLGTDDPQVVVGIGTNVDWPGSAFPPELAATMTSLREIRGGSVDRDALLDAFLGRLESGIAALRAGTFDVAGWSARQVTTGRPVRIDVGGGLFDTRALGVDASTGALIVADAHVPGAERLVHAGEIVQLRLTRAAGPAARV